MKPHLPFLKGSLVCGFTPSSEAALHVAQACWVQGLTAPMPCYDKRMGEGLI